MKKQKKTKGKRKDSVFRLLNPKYLQKEVHIYGYNFSQKTHLGMIACVLIGAVAIGLLFKLSIPLITVIGVFGIVIMPVMILDMYKRMYQQKRFEEVGQYMEQIVRAYQKEQKIYTSLIECEKTFEPGRMKEVLREAIEAIKQSKTTQEALAIIEASYECDKIHATHEFLLNAEEHGGSDDFFDSSNMLIKDNSMWIRRGYTYHSQRKQQYTDTLVGIVFATVLCSTVLYILNYIGTVLKDMTSGFDIFSQPFIQISSLLYIIFAICVVLKSSHKLTDDWLKDNQAIKEDLILNDYDTVMNYDEKKSSKKSLVWAAPFLIGSVVSYLLISSKVVCAILLVLAVFMLVQHKVGYNIALNTIKDELGNTVPIWFMDLNLLLQHNTVYVALTKSYDNADIIIKKELDRFFDELDVTPDSVDPYLHFCSKFQMPEISACMKMLYSVSEQGIGDKKMQLDGFIQSVYEMQNRADERKKEDMELKYQRFFFYPIAITTLKMAGDMTYGIMLALSLMSSIHIGG
ncbi:hypothetical protein H8Z76_13105 [Roseburia sp. BX0805]|uniref:Flp pilus assembly protein TadB n=2 Tax=Bacillota TaxID=1239 RepID=A0ABR7IDC1_9FIRM|nr:hypothetical protein [Roseburia yibonii]MBC5754921.1 hypothetical protein [Roseburia yibonii]